MLRMIVRRALIAIPLLLLVSFLVYALSAISSADPARAILGEGATPESIAQLRHELGLDQPFLVRYVHWLGQVLQGSLGNSWYGNIPVVTKITQAMPTTISLVLVSVIVTAVVAVPVGLTPACTLKASSPASRGRSPGSGWPCRSSGSR